MIPIWLWTLPLDLVNDAARTHGIERELLAAVCSHESAGNQLATRYEKGYRWLVRPADFAAALGIEHADEVRWQMTSLGLCQVMGATARDLGFIGIHEEFFEPRVNLDYGARYLKSKIERYGSITDALAAYNAGSVRLTAGGRYVNETYVDRVMMKYRELKGP